MRLPVHDPSSERPLMPHQRRCLEWISRRGLNNAALLMEMRTGKTLTAIRTARDVWRCEGLKLVIAPTTVLAAWQIELEREQQPSLLIAGRTRSQKEKLLPQIVGKLWVLTNYESVRVFPELLALSWDLIVLDESTRIKNPKAQVSKVLTTKCRHIPHRMILTGLPNPESDLDLFQQFKFLDGQFLGCSSYWAFRNKYCVQLDDWGKWNTTREAHKKLVDTLASQSFMLSRKDVDLGGAKIQQVRHIEMGKEQHTTYMQVLDDYEFMVPSSHNNTTYAVGGDDDEEVDDNGTHQTNYAMQQSIWLSRIVGGCDINGNWLWDAKYNELLTLLKEDLSPMPVVIWCRFTSEIAHITEKLNADGIEARSLDGSVLPENRRSLLEWFNTCSAPSRALVMQAEVARYGIDASVADTAIYYSWSAKAESLAQSKDRIIHPLRKSPSLYIFLCIEDSIDIASLEAVNGKVVDAQMVLEHAKQLGKKRTSHAYS